MAKETDNTMKLPPKCKCCLGEEDLQDMWTVTTEDDEPEIFGEMLNECFALPWDHQDDGTEFICEFCIQRLKDAVSFKHQIVFAHDVMQDNADIVTSVDENGKLKYEVKIEEASEDEKMLESVKQEPGSDGAEYLEVEYLDDVPVRTEEKYADQVHSKKSLHSRKGVQKPGRKHQMSPLPVSRITRARSSSRKRKQSFTTDLESCVTSVQTSLMTPEEATDYFHIPMDVLMNKLKQENVVVEKEDENERITRGYKDTMNMMAEYVVLEDEPDEVEYLEAEFFSDADTPGKEQSNSRLLTKSKKDRIYVKYTQTDMENCINSVVRKEMTRTQASANYNVPYKTLCNKLKDIELLIGKPKEKDRGVLTEKQAKLIQEVKLLLTYTNATPFKSKSCKYYCAYCSTEGPFYEDTNLLRVHTRTQHATDKLTGVDHFLRPQSINELAKIDIQNLTCTVCCDRLDSWNGMFQHLADQHQVEFDEAYTRVIPFIIDQDLFCVLCKMKFDSYNQLDCHMNAHFTNYVCGTCGDTFMSESRLKKHEETHELGRYECQYCDKVFSLSKYRKKHTLSIHLHEEKFRCRYCKQGFQSNYIRHHHMIEKHNLKVKIYKCNQCNKSFNWKPYYLKHVRLIHREKVKKHVCLLCDKKFLMHYELRNHYEWHEGTNKHVCLICDKKFASNQYLQKHMGKHGSVTTVSAAE